MIPPGVIEHALERLIAWAYAVRSWQGIEPDGNDEDSGREWIAARERCLGIVSSTEGALLRAALPLLDDEDATAAEIAEALVQMALDRAVTVEEVPGDGPLSLVLKIDGDAIEESIARAREEVERRFGVRLTDPIEERQAEADPPAPAPAPEPGDLAEAVRAFADARLSHGEGSIICGEARDRMFALVGRNQMGKAAPRLEPIEGLTVTASALPHTCSICGELYSPPDTRCGCGGSL